MSRELPPTAVAIDRVLLATMAESLRTVARDQGNEGVIDLCDRLSAIASANSDAEAERLYREQEQGRDEELVDAALADLLVVTPERVLAVAGLYCHSKPKVCDQCLKNTEHVIRHYVPAVIGVSKAVTREGR